MARWVGSEVACWVPLSLHPTYILKKAIAFTNIHIYYQLGGFYV